MKRQVFLQEIQNISYRDLEICEYCFEDCTSVAVGSLVSPESFKTFLPVLEALFNIPVNEHGSRYLDLRRIWH